MSQTLTLPPPTHTLSGAWNAVTTLRDDTKAEYFYIYAGDDPANLTDPSGMTPWSPCGSAQQSGGGAYCGGAPRAQWCSAHFSACYPNRAAKWFEAATECLNPFAGVADLVKEFGKKKAEAYVARRAGEDAAKLFAKRLARLNLVGLAAECGVEIYSVYR